MEQIYDVIIIGAGPSGLFCAYHLPHHLKVLLLEKGSLPAQKLLLSAKGRGNLTNLMTSEKKYFPENEPFVKNVFKHYGPSDFLLFLKKHEIAYHEEDFGRILLDHNVKIFHSKLLDCVEKQGRQIHFLESCYDIKRNQELFQIFTDKTYYYSKNVIISTGSPSVPSLGTTDFASQVAQNFSLSFVPFYPALVGFNTEKNLSSLSGSSVLAQGELRIQNQKLYEQYGPILFTHRGISGPVVFNASLFLRGKEKEKKNQIVFKMKIKASEITKRFLSYLGFRENKLPEYFFTTNIHSVRGMEEAKVCGGGITLLELDPFFQVVQVPGLFFLGESVDVTGQTGGFNLQRCRSSAFCCAQFFSL